MAENKVTGKDDLFEGALLSGSIGGIAGAGGELILTGISAWGKQVRLNRLGRQLDDMAAETQDLIRQLDELQARPTTPNNTNRFEQIADPWLTTPDVPYRGSQSGSLNPHSSPSNVPDSLRDTPTRMLPEAYYSEVSGSRVVDLSEFNRLNRVDFAKNKTNPGEAGAAVELQNIFDSEIRAATPADGDVDFVFKSGILQDKTVDFMFTVSNVKQLDMMNKHFDKNLQKTTDNILAHVSKSDIVPFDFRNLTPQNQTKVLKIIKSLSREEQSRIYIIK